jgi:PAS domain-containing protein
MQFDWTMNLPPAAAMALALFAVVGGAVAVRNRQQKARQRDLERRATADRLSAALDRIDIGVVLLNSDTRAEFINRAFREQFRLPDAKADSKPPLIALMYHCRDNHAFELPEDEVDSFVARRVEMIRAGDPTPTNLRLADGQVLRLSCTALPDGGRMLSCTPVTDLVRRSDDRADRDHYLSIRETGDLFAERHLDAAE